MLIVDLSGSMLAEDVGGGSRLDAAKAAASELVDSVPDDAQLGLMVYGQQESSAPENQEAGCKDIQVISPVGKGDKSKMKQDIAGFAASGYTPIGNSLRSAADELGKEGERSIILVSDGIDTCAPPPVCEVAKELGGAGYGLTIHTVGFKVDEAARAELECVAQATGGEFRTAGDARELADSMTFLATRSLVGHEAVGTEFEFADDPADAKWLGEGRYRTTVVPEIANDADGANPLYYRIAIPKDHNAIVILKAIPNRNEEGEGEQDLTFAIEADNDSSEKCQDTRSNESISTTVPANNYEPSSGFYTVITTDPEDGMDPACDQTQWNIGNKVFVDGSDVKAEFRDNPVVVEVEVQFEPQVMKRDRGQLHQGWHRMEKESVPEVSFGDASRITGGASTAKAIELSSGETHADSIVKGEMKYYKVPVEWGQRPVVAIRTKENQLDDAVRPSVLLLNPFYGKDYVVGRELREENIRTIAVNRPIEFMNRSSDRGGGDVAYAGYYYIVVGVSETDAEKLQGTEQEYELSVLLDGKPTKGPDWRPVEVNGPKPSDKPILSDKETASATAKPTESASGEATTSQASESVEAMNTSASEDKRSNLPMKILAAVAGFLILLLVLAFVILRIVKELKK